MSTNSLISQYPSPLDPSYGIRQRAKRREHSPANSQQPQKYSGGSQDEKSERLMRERSIRTNRRHKFLECITSQDVSICMPISHILNSFAQPDTIPKPSSGTQKTCLGGNPSRSTPSRLATSPCAFSLLFVRQANYKTSFRVTYLYPPHCVLQHCPVNAVNISQWLKRPSPGVVKDSTSKFGIK